MDYIEAEKDGRKVKVMTPEGLRKAIREWKITKENSQDYVDDFGQHCPLCKSTNFHYEEDRFLGISGENNLHVRCTVCGYEFIEVYKLSEIVSFEGLD